jgi:type IV secretion system protein VirB6
MQLEIGSSEGIASTRAQQSLRVSYAITPSSTVSPISGVNVPQNANFNADQDGYLWLQVNSSDQSGALYGNITVNYGGYVGSTVFSDAVYNYIITPIQNEFAQVTQKFYKMLIADVFLQNIAHAMLVIYVIMYGLFFLIGMTKITVEDLVGRVIKISIVVELFSPTSWNFFNQYLFHAFLEGSNYLMTSAAGTSSSTTNIFGFIDPIFDRYTNPTVWGLLLIQLLQIQNCLFVFAIMTIYGIVIYCRAVLEVIVTYCLAFIGMSVMICLAPFFILLILFERTRSMFDNWLSTLFSYMIQPTMLLIFFLLIDQVISTQLYQTITKACWGCWIDLVIGLDLNNMKIPISFSFQLPFLPCIPFFVTQIEGISDSNQLFGKNGTFLAIATSSLIFYCMAEMSEKLMVYVRGIVTQLSGTSPRIAAKTTGGNSDGGRDAAESVMGDITGITDMVTEPVKRKVNDLIFGKDKEDSEESNSKIKKEDEAEKQEYKDNLSDIQDNPNQSRVDTNLKTQEPRSKTDKLLSTKDPKEDKGKE